MKVAIIGGGFSGILAAYLLEKKGVKVSVFEKEEYIGGHCKTIQNKDSFIELGTVLSFSKEIKELLIELKIDYSERFVYRNFVDENYHYAEHMLREDVILLMEEFSRLKVILEKYSPYLKEIDFGYIPDELIMPLDEFLKKHDLRFISQIILPHLSSFGFGNISDITAYYVFKVFNIDTLYSFIAGEKFLSVNKGTSEIINKLSENISDIRYSLGVTNVEVVDDRVKVDTQFSSEYFDKVLISTKLPDGVIKDELYNDYMKKIDTNPFITCAFDVTNKDIVTTYYKSHLGVKGKIQFFYVSKQNDKTLLVAFAYGHASKDIIDNIKMDIEKVGIDINNLVTVKQWYIFPHLKSINLYPSFYKDIHDMQKFSKICLIGSLVSKPSIDNLYLSVKNTIEHIT